MKKILLFIGLLGIVSCRPIEEGSPYSQIPQVEINKSYRSGSLNLFEFEFKGHTYFGLRNKEISGIIHDPECLKCKENESAY